MKGKKRKARFKVLEAGKFQYHNIIAFDIETKTGENSEKGSFLFGGMFNGKQYIYFTDREKMREYMCRTGFAGVTFVAHNLEYDLNRIFLDDPDIIRYYLGSRFIFAKYPLKNGWNANQAGNEVKQSFNYINYYDTSALSYYQPLAVLGEKLGIPKFEARFDDRITQEAIDYNRRDCEICFKYAVDMQETLNKWGTGWRGTAAGISFEYYRRGFMPECAEYWAIPESIIKDFRDAYYGGRNEVFNFGKFDKVFYYDINSSYPFAMTKDMPLLDSWVNKANLDKDGVCFCEITCPDMMFPPLPVRREKLIFPIGNWTGMYCNNELRAMMERVPGLKVKIIKGIHYKKSYPIFRDYIEHMYKKRKESKNESDKLLLKLLMNSLYGRFGLSSELEKIQGGLREKITGSKVYANVLWAAYITAYARIELFDLIRKTQSIYCDTDSSLTETRIETSSELGGVSLKGKFTDFHARGNKFYYYTEDGKKKRRIKGISEKAVETAPNVWENEQPVKYRSAKARDIPLFSWIKVTKHLDTNYDKRIIMKDGSTRAIRLDEKMTDWRETQ